MKAWYFAAAVLSLATASTGAGERLSMKVSPAVSFAPANLIVQTTVEADNANRAIEIVAESEQFYRSSEQPLDGDRAPRTTRFEFKGLPGGLYDVKAVLKGPGGHELASVASHVNVVENGSVMR
jgi:hypothetical protein